MNKRKSISKKTRFEVFKRDHFACQYCGMKAPDVVLTIDHIHPVAAGGPNDVLNYITACTDCNSGKGARLLDDRSVIERQRAQLEELQERREQLQMMLAWRDELEKLKGSTVDLIADRIEDRGGFVPNENGRANIRRWLKRFSFDEILTAVDEAFDIYMRWVDDEPDKAAWEIAFKKIPGVCSIRRQSVEKPWLQRLFYVQGILRRRFHDRHGRYVNALEEMVIEWKVTVEDLENAAKRANDWDHFNDLVIAICQRLDHSENVGNS